MTDLKQAAQQALEALETLMLERGSIYETAITALSEALAQEHALHELARLGQEIEQEPTPWQGLTDVEIHKTTVLMGFNPEWKTEIGVAYAIVRNLEAQLKQRNK